MSSRYIKNVKIDKKNKRVFITSYCSNVIPKEAERWECKYYNNFFEKYGNNAEEEIIKNILRDFNSGMNYGEATDYGKSVELYYERNPDVNRFGRDDATDEEMRTESKQRVNELYKFYLQFKKDKKEKYFVKLNGVYVRKLTAARAKTCYHPDGAKLFTKNDLPIIKRRFSNCEMEVIKQ